MTTTKHFSPPPGPAPAMISGWIAGITITAAFSGLTACTPNDGSVARHDGPVPTESVVHAPVGEPANGKALLELDLEPRDRRLHTTGGSSNSGGGGESRRDDGESTTPNPDVDTDIETLERLKPYMLFGTYIEDPAFLKNTQTREKLRAMLGVWNRALLRLYQNQPAAANERKYLDAYAVVMLSGCTEDLKGCLNIGFFRQDPDSAEVLELLARRTENEIAKAKDNNEAKDRAVRAYYKYLSLSFELRNRRLDRDFEFLYLNRAGDLAAAYSRDTAGRGRNAALQRHSEIFEMILNRFETDRMDPALAAQFEKFVANFSPWTYSRLAPNPFGAQAATKMLDLAARKYLYENDGPNAPLNASLRKAIEDSQKIDDPDPKGSFASVVKELREKNPTLFRGLALNDDFPRDEYFFMIDRLFRDHLTPDDVSGIWSGSRKDAPRLLRTVEAYLKIEIARMIVATNRYMSSVYADRDKYSSKTMFINTIDKSLTISNQWHELLARIDRVALFVNRHMKTVQGTASAGGEFKRVDEMLTSLRRNIKLISVYPNMMLMAYFMEEIDGEFKIRSMFGAELTIDAADIIRAFLQGQLSPLFNFGNDGEPLRRLETLDAFYFALKTETFKAFNVDGQTKVDEARFFEKVIGKYLAGDRKTLMENTSSLMEKIGRSSTYNTFLLTCAHDREVLRSGGTPGGTGPMIQIDFANEFPLATYMGHPNVGFGDTALKYYDTSLTGRVKFLRTNVLSKLTYVDSMVAILASHLESIATPEAERAALIQTIQSNLSGIHDTRTALLTEIWRRHSEISGCVAQTLRIEFARQQSLIKMEEQHLRDVYRRIKAAQNENDIAKINKEFLVAPLKIDGTSLPPGFEGVGRITKDEYVYADLDQLLRLRGFMSAIAPRVNIVMPADLTDTPLWRNRRQNPIPTSLSEDEFVRAAMRNFNGSGNASIRWVSAAGDQLKILMEKLRFLTELYRYGPFEIFDWTSPSCAGGADLTRCPRTTVRVTARDVVSDLAELIRLVSLTNIGSSGAGGDAGQPTEDARMMELIGLTSRFDKSSLSEFFFNPQGAPLSLAENLYQTLANDSEARREAREYSDSQKSVGHFLFSRDPSVERDLRSQYMPFVTNFNESVRELEEAIHWLESQDAATGRILELGYEIRNGTVAAIRPAREGQTPVYLKRERIRNFENSKSIFEKENPNLFKTPQETEKR